MDGREQIGIIESVLFMAGEPVKLKDIASLFEISGSEAKELMDSVCEKYESVGTGLRLVCLEGNYQLVTNKEYAPWIEKFLGVDKRKQLPTSLVETVAVIAYKQPITRAEIEYIRGVKCDYSVKKLLEYGLIEQAGKKDVPGKPFLYATTPKFLRTFGISSIDELPQVEVDEDESGEEV